MDTKVDEKLLLFFPKRWEFYREKNKTKQKLKLALVEQHRGRTIKSNESGRTKDDVM